MSVALVTKREKIDEIKKTNTELHALVSKRRKREAVDTG